MSEILLGSQVRAARAMIDWSQDDLAKGSGVSLSMIKDFEAGRRDLAFDQIESLRTALTRAGIEFIALNKSGGPGVRLASEMPIISKRPQGVSFETDNLPFRVEWRGEEAFVFLPSMVLDDLDRTNHKGDPAHLASFKKHEDLILQKTAQALYAGRLDDRRRLQLRSRDFFPR